MFSNQLEASTQPDIYAQKENQQVKMKVNKIKDILNNWVLRKINENMEK